MRRPSPSRRRRSQQIIPESESSTNIRTNKKTTKTPKKHFQSNFVVISSSHQTDSPNNNDKDDSKDYDSTASTPKVKRKNLGKKIAATERKYKLSKFNETLGTTSAPSKLKINKDETGIRAENDVFKIRKNLFCPPEEEDDNDFYLNFHPSSTIGYEGFDTAFVIPEWMPILFRPTRKMNLNEICSYTAAYIFMRDDDKKYGDEVLVKSTSGVFGDRKTLKSLMPRCPIDQEIINLVVARKNWLIDSMGKTKSVWYMPSEFAQYALEKRESADYVRGIYQHRFMPTKGCVSKVVTATRMKLALYLVQSSNNVLLNEIVSKAANYWEVQEKKQKALVKI